jgi:hypothetical protein
VWGADLTCIPMQRGVAYLVAVMDWNTRGGVVEVVQHAGGALLRGSLQGGGESGWAEKGAVKNCLSPVPLLGVIMI